MPLNPKEYCDHPDGLPALDAEGLSFVWLPEGFGVALYAGESLLAAILPEEVSPGVRGVSHHACKSGPLGVRLSAVPEVLERFEAAKAHWAEWEEPPTPFTHLREGEMSAYDAQFGTKHKLFVFRQDGWPPLGVCWYKREDAHVLVTLGMALRPMHGLEGAVKSPAYWRRAELGLVLHPGYVDSFIEDLVGFLGAQADIAWKRKTWVGPGHTIGTHEFSPGGYPNLGLVRAVDSKYPCELPSFQGDSVHLLWLVPLTAAERTEQPKGQLHTYLATLPLPRPLSAEKSAEA